MKKLWFSNRLSLFLCFAALITAMALTFSGCGDKKNDSDGVLNPDTAEKNAVTTAVGNSTEVGEGRHYFTLTVKEADGKEASFSVRSDEKTVGDALLNSGLIEGDKGQYGLYVKTVNGITADYDTDGTYWAFYINGEYAMAAIDSTEITDGAVYTLSRES